MPEQDKYDIEYIEDLKNAFKGRGLTLYLGAGVSQANGLPGWEELIVSLYYQTIQDGELADSFKPFPNYLYAIAEWQLQRSKLPLDVIVRRCKNAYHKNPDLFLQNLKINLYKSLGLTNTNFKKFKISPEEQKKLRDKNPTLKAVVELCKKSRPPKKGIASIITYNYDNLLDLMLLDDNDDFISIWKEGQDVAHLTPIYHVHGYIPAAYENINEDEIILSEQQYNMMSQDAYYWGNIIQTNQLLSNTGLMIGLSLTDRNIRRILDAVDKMPCPTHNYIILPSPKKIKITENSEDIKKISEKAKEYVEKFVDGGIKRPEKAPHEIIRIIDRISNSDSKSYKNDFADLGLKVIWIDDFKEIPHILKKISG